MSLTNLTLRVFGEKRVIKQELEDVLANFKSFKIN